MGRGEVHRNFGAFGPRKICLSVILTEGVINLYTPSHEMGNLVDHTIGQYLLIGKF